MAWPSRRSGPPAPPGSGPLCWWPTWPRPATARRTWPPPAASTAKPTGCSWTRCSAGTTRPTCWSTTPPAGPSRPCGTATWPSSRRPWTTWASTTTTTPWSRPTLATPSWGPAACRPRSRRPRSGGASPPTRSAGCWSGSPPTTPACPCTSPRTGPASTTTSTPEAGSPTSSGSTTWPATSPPPPGRSPRASTCAATSCGPCWTTSSGPRATPSGSGWSSWSTAASGASPRPAPTGCGSASAPRLFRGRASMPAVTGMPLPGTGRAAVAVPAPGPGPGHWVGAPSAALDRDGSFVVAYRVRVTDQRGAATVVARSEDGERLTTVAVLDKARFGAESMERPALVRTETGRWRLYVCSATPQSKHWWIDALEADDPAGLANAEARTVFGGDDRTGVKDPVIRQGNGGWHAWICCPPLDVPDEEDRMTTAYATSEDGLVWDWHGTVLGPRPGMWDARGARVTAVLPDGGASY